MQNAQRMPFLFTKTTLWTSDSDPSNTAYNYMCFILHWLIKVLGPASVSITTFYDESNDFVSANENQYSFRYNNKENDCHLYYKCILDCDGRSY